VTLGAVAAIDLGATSGRVVLGHVDDGTVRLDVVERFLNNPVRYWEGTADALHWNMPEQFRSILIGLRKAAQLEPKLRSIGVDSWGLDYGLLRRGALLDNPYSHRDERTAAGVASTHEIVTLEQLYAVNGLQFMPINTVYQFAADRLAGRTEPGDVALLLPDLIGYWLTGVAVAERTNASTTGLLDVLTREWSSELITRLGLSETMFPALADPGSTLGPLLSSTSAEIGAQIPVVAVASHDTASAVVGVPAVDDEFAYVSCGTWALVGVELEHPVLSSEARQANFTNEGGLDGRIRFLQNIMGLWLLSESIRAWQRDGHDFDLVALIAEAASLSTGSMFDANDPRLLMPGDMPTRIAQCCADAGQPVPQTPAEFVRAINESLAAAIAHAIRTATRLSGKTVKAIHLVGGGSQNELLCQLVADHSMVPVIAGPVEATAFGNVLVQARAGGLISGSLESLRAVIARSVSLRRFVPRFRRR
jgi:rhamnulokinase